MPRILSISYDPVLLSTRQLMLESRGYEVTSAVGFVEALAHCKGGKYDLLIMGHSIPIADKEALIAEAHKSCPAMVLSLQRHNEPMPEGATDEADPQRPDQLLEAVKRLTK